MTTTDQVKKDIHGKVWEHWTFRYKTAHRKTETNGEGFDK